MKKTITPRLRRILFVLAMAVLFIMVVVVSVMLGESTVYGNLY